MKMENEVKIEELPKRIKGNFLKDRVQEKKILTNYFPVKIKPMKSIHIFKVVFEPKIMNDNRTFRSKLLNEAFPSIKKQINNPVMGGMNIYSVSQPFQVEATHQVQGYKITIKQVKCLDVKENPKVLLQFLNNGIRNIMASLNYTEIGHTGKYFNMNKGTQKQLVANLDLYRGLKANFLFAEAGMFLRIDPANKIIQNKTVLETINHIYSYYQSKDREEKRQMVKEKLINQIVMTNYGKTRYVRIEDIEFKPLAEVLIDGNQNLNIIQYYQTKYGLKVNERQPLLRIVNKNKKDTNTIYMLPEHCLMTGLPDDMDQRLRKAVSEETIVPPQKKYGQIKDFVKQIKENVEQKVLMDLGIQIEKKSQEVLGKQLRSPCLKLGNNYEVQKGKESFFSLFSQPLYNTSHKLRIGLIYFYGMEVGQLIDTFTDTGKRLGLDLKMSKISINKNCQDANDTKNQILGAVRDAMKDNNCCLIILRPNMKTYYKNIKKECVQAGIITQVMLQNTNKKNNRSVFTKVLLQMAAKIGNALWKPSVPKEIEKGVMLLSFDVSKSGGERKIVGVSSTNSSLTSVASQSDSLDDVADKFHKMVKIGISLVTKYLKINGMMPVQIIILTNSCPKNEVQLYFNYFIPHFKEELRSISGSPVKLMVIQIKDLSNQRFFAQYEDNINNPNAGLLVANTIVSDNYDFYLISQKPRVGCTVPIHFNVIYSDSQLEEGVIQELMYSQCFSYYNWTGSIKIPAIMQYTKKFARFCSENLKNNASQSLANKLYFI